MLVADSDQWEARVLLLWRNWNRRLSGSLGATLNREIGFVSSSFRFVRGVRASGRGEAASACEVQSVPSGQGSAVGSSTALFVAPLRSSGRGVYVGFKANWVQV